MNVDVPRAACCLLAALIAFGGAQAQDPPAPEERVDLRRTLIDLAVAADPDLRAGRVRAQLDVFQIELAERLSGVSGGAGRAAALARYFFEEALLESDDDLTDPDNFYVDEVLARRKGYCLSLSAIILAVARRLDLPVHGVAAPRHFFVRWDDGDVRVNIETTEGGRARSDGFYRRLGVSPAAERDGVFLRNLEDRQVVAYLLNNEGFVHWARGDLDGAERRFREAIRLHPVLAEARINLGVIAGERGDGELARRHFSQALRWIPGDVPTHFNRSLAALRAGRYREALEDMERAALLDPENRHVDRYRRLVLATVLRPDNWAAYQRSLAAAGERLRRAGRLAPGLRGRYFRDRAMEHEAAVRIDREIEFDDWRWGRPHPDVPADGFAIRWEGFVDVPERGTYTIFTVANDGVRVWFDGVRIIDDWKLNEGALNRESLELEKGLHPVRIDYFEHRRFAGVSFRVKRAESSRPLGPRHYHHLR